MTPYKNRLRLSISEFEETEHLLSHMINEYRSCRPSFVSSCTAYFIQLVCFLSRCYDKAPDSTDKLSTFAKAVAHIERCFTQKISLDEIAAIAGLSVRHFQRQFKSTYQITPQEYIQSLRMQRAVMLLMRTDSSVTDISLECGYHDSNLFSRQFRKHTGHSPRQYRELHRSSARK